MASNRPGLHQVSAGAVARVAARAAYPWCSALVVLVRLRSSISLFFLLCDSSPCTGNQDKFLGTRDKLSRRRNE